MQSTSITLFDVTIRMDADGRYCLNDLHKAAMAQGHATESQRPGSFLKSEPIKEFVALLDSDATQGASVKAIKGGVKQGTYASELVALRYAGWISPKVEVEVYRTFQKVANADESLTHDLIERQTDPEAVKRLAARAQGKVARLAFTDGLQQHGVTGAGFGMCTNAIYRALFDTDANGLKQLKNLPQKANVREAMNRRELVATMFAEEVALARIERENSQGNIECAKQSYGAGKETRQVMESRKTLEDNKKAVL